MGGVLLVPMHCSAMRNVDHRRVVPATVDFARLPWSDGRHDHNDNHPYLSTSVLNPPFASDHFELHPGTHLHWMLPAVYRRGFLDRGQKEHIYCPAPNFWLIRTTRPDSAAQFWVVESDVLAQPTHFQHASGSVMPFDGESGTPPFRMIGRMMRIEDWRKMSPTPARYPNLTAMGYGDSAYSSYYPACARSFGFHDFDTSQTPTSYEILGWRRETRLNVLQWLYDETLVGEQQSVGDLFDDALFTKVPGKQRKTTLGWKLVNAGDSGHRKVQPGDTVICYSRMTVTGSGRLQEPGASSVSIGSNAANALTAYLVEESIKGERSDLQRHQLEEQLDHLNATEATARVSSDKYFRFLEHRHESSFTSISGGIRWSLRNEPHEGAANAENTGKREAQSIPSTFFTQLAQINRLQSGHDHASDRLASLREQLFADWHHYQLAMYPAHLHSGVHTNADEIRNYIEQVTLPEVEHLSHEIDRLTYLFNDDQTLARAELIGPTDSQQTNGHSVEGIGEALNTLMDELALYNSTFICAQLQGNATRSGVISTTDADFIQFNGADDYAGLTHIDGLGDATLRAGEPLSQFTVSFRLKVDPGHGGVILSFDPTMWFEVEVPSSGDAAGRLVFTTSNSQGEQHRMVSSEAVDSGSWLYIAVGLDDQPSVKFIQIGEHREESEASGSVGGGGARRGVLGASTSALPFSDEQEVAPGFVGAISDMHMIIGPVDESRLRALLDPENRPRLSLRQTVASRFWQPREPSVAIVGEDAQNSDPRSSEHHFPHDALQCIYLERFPAVPDIDGHLPARDQLEEIFTELFGSIDAEVADPRSYGFNHSNGHSWRPMIAEWEVGLYPLAVNDLHNGQSSHYDPEFVRTAYEMRRESVDLELRPEQRALARTQSFLNGRTFLSPNHAHALHDKLNALINARDGNVSSELKQTFLQLDADRDRTLCFPLEGLLAAMRQKRQILQLPVDDPLAFTEYRQFTHRVQKAVGRHRTLSPDPVLDFNPIQSGAMELCRLRLIDNFGQHREQRLDSVNRITRLRADEHSNLISLPARIAQPARLDFRWLQALDPTEEAAEHTPSSPICGWLTVNDLDGYVAVHDAAGHALGALTPDSDLIWQPLPGMQRPIAPSQFSSAALRRSIDWLTRQGETFIELFARVLEHSLDQIHPESFGADEWALMSGRPLAIVQVKLELLLHGLPSMDQGYGALYQRLATGRHRDADFESVKFPVRLGDHRQVSDGLVGYWLSEDNGRLSGSFHAPNAGAITAARVKAGISPSTKLPISGESEPPLIPLSINQPARTLTLLFDPRGRLQASSGILPVKTITLPDAFYQPALARMRPAFFSAPVLTPGGTLSLPLPRHQGLQWHWLERRKEQWRRIDQAEIGDSSNVANGDERLEIREGWLELNSRPDSRT